MLDRETQARVNQTVDGWRREVLALGGNPEEPTPDEDELLLLRLIQTVGPEVALGASWWQAFQQMSEEELESLRSHPAYAPPQVLKHLPGKHDQQSHSGGRRARPRTPSSSSDDDAEDGPAVTDDFDEAVRLLSEGKSVELDSVEKVYTMLDRLAKYAKAARAAGKDAPNLDLCKVSVPGTNLFCGGNLGIERAKMPQLSGKPRPGSRADSKSKNDKGEVNLGEEFQQHLRDKGVEVRDETIPASQLRASQAELVGPNVAWMMTEGAEMLGIGQTGRGNRIFVSRDGYVIDGHHRWAATVGMDSSDGKLGDLQMDVVVIDMPISDVLREATRFADDEGILPKAAKAARARSWRVPA